MILGMWMLAMIIACSAGDQVCSYSMPGQVFDTRARCEIVGNLVAGGMMATPIGRFEHGKIEVSCRPMARAKGTDVETPRTELASEPKLEAPAGPK